MNDLYDAIEALDLEDDESFFFEDDEADDEARRNGRAASRFRRPVKTGKGGGYYRPRPPTGGTKYVTQPQLQAALARVSADVKANSEGIKTVNARLNTLSTEQAAHGTAIRKEVAERKKEGAQLKADAKKARDFAMLQLFLQKPPKVFDKDGTTELKVVDQNDFLLPLVLMGGLGGGGDAGGGMGDNMLLMFLLLGKK
ncbi:MAG TPA: hypothetical protein VFJ82_14545 [Longimicrobium sp.]|nr:hypothetical protein [Longimicrobium sp.]